MASNSEQDVKIVLYAICSHKKNSYVDCDKFYGNLGCHTEQKKPKAGQIQDDITHV